MQNLNVGISDDAHKKLDVIQTKQGFKNRNDTVEWLIAFVFEHLKLKEAES